MTAAGEHQLELRAALPNARERLEEKRVVLVRPGARGVEQERLACAAVRMENACIDSVMDDTDARRVKPKHPDRSVADEGAGDDHPISPTCGSVVRVATKEPYVTRNKRRKIEVQEIVQRHDARPRSRRQGDRQRVMDDIYSSERSAGGGRTQKCNRAGLR
jgi:hypothetical protein